MIKFWLQEDNVSSYEKDLIHIFQLKHIQFFIRIFPQGYHIQFSRGVNDSSSMIGSEPYKFASKANHSSAAGPAESRVKRRANSAIIEWLDRRPGRRCGIPSFSPPALAATCYRFSVGRREAGAKFPRSRGTCAHSNRDRRSWIFIGQQWDRI